MTWCVMTRHGRPSLPSFLRIFQNLKEKISEDKGYHFTNFHLWCSSNSLNDDSICLRLFQCTLTRVVVKWYIELLGGTCINFNQMILFFINHFQLLVRYNSDIEIFSAFSQDKATHISDHIQEWCRQKRLIKSCIPPEFMLEWFHNSLFLYISKDVSTSRETSEEEAIFKAQKLDHIYAQSQMLCEIILDMPRPNYDPRKKHGPYVNGIIGSANDKSIDLVTNRLNDLSLSYPVVGQALTYPSTPTQSMDVHSI
jgi:hypothetical protein